MIAPDEMTYRWLEGGPFAPSGGDFEAALARWNTLRSDEGAVYERSVVINAGEVAPMVTWGTSPEAVVSISGAVPDPAQMSDAGKRKQVQGMLEYMGLIPGTPLRGIPLDVVFTGSCTSGRIEDLRSAAAVIRGRQVAPHVRALVVPGSGEVKAQAEDSNDILQWLLLTRRQLDYFGRSATALMLKAEI